MGYRLMAYLLKLKQRKTMKKIILAAVLFLPFLVSCSQNRKAPAVSPQTAEEKSEKTETAKVQYLTTSDFRKRLWITRLIRMVGLRRFPSCRHRFLYHLVWSLQDDGSSSRISRREVCRQGRFLRWISTRSPNLLLFSVSAASLPSSSSP